MILAAAVSPFRQIVVQPHLLFHGELLDRLEENVSAAATTALEKTWRTSRILGEKPGSLSRILLPAILAAGNR